jgi:hypothetical protein
MFGLNRTLLPALLLSLSATAQAEVIPSGPPMRTFTQAEIEAVAMPDLAYEPDPGIEADFDKYFFFHREDTSFDQAFDDIAECDALAHGMNFPAIGWWRTAPEKIADFGPVLGTYFATIGSPIDAIFGSSERRRDRRLNLRNCMFYKGYDRYGLEKSLWQAFHFEEGFSRENARDRYAALLKQARVASGPKPPLEVLAP